MGNVIYIEKFNSNRGKIMTKNRLTRYSRSYIESITHDVLSSNDINKTPVDPVVIANKLGIKVYSRNFNNYYGDTVSGAITKDEDGKITILVNENDSKKRQRFTVAHELGHYFLHIQNSPKYERVDMHRANGYSTNDSQEIEANNFAAALLMDKGMLLEEFESAARFGLSKLMCTHHLAEIFGVSRDAMEYRLKNVGIL